MESSRKNNGRFSYSSERNRDASLESCNSNGRYQSNDNSPRRHGGSTTHSNRRKMSRERNYDRRRSYRRKEERRGNDTHHSGRGHDDHHSGRGHDDHYSSKGHDEQQSNSNGRYNQHDLSSRSSSESSRNRSIPRTSHRSDYRRRSSRHRSSPHSRRGKTDDKGDYISSRGGSRHSPHSHYNSGGRRSSPDSYRSTSDISDDDNEYFHSRGRSYRSLSPSKSTATSHFVVIQGLSPSCTEDLLEERIRAISIQKGFSLPNSVILERNLADPQTDSISYVEFPSIDASSRFLRVLGNKSTLFVANRHCPVESPHLRDLPQHILSSALQATATNNPSAIRNDFIGYKDWNCPLCNYHNFARRAVCGSCGGPRVDDPITPAKGVEGTISNHSLTMNNQSSLTFFPTLKPPPASPNSSWIVLKDISTSETVESITQAMQSFNHPIQQVLLFQPDTITDVASNSLVRGFCFIIFESPTIASKIILLIHSNEVELWDKAVRADILSTLEKHAFIDMQNAILDDTPLTINELERISTSHGASSYWKEYVQQWTTRSIYLPEGLPAYTTFVLEPISGYLYNESMRLYYDPSTQFYISLRGDYYVWEEALLSLRRVYTLELQGNFQNTSVMSDNNFFNPYESNESTDDYGVAISDGTQSYFSSSNLSQPTTTEKAKQKDNTSAIANILAAAQQTAKASIDTAKVMETVSDQKGPSKSLINTVNSVNAHQSSAFSSHALRPTKSNDSSYTFQRDLEVNSMHTTTNIFDKEDPFEFTSQSQKLVNPALHSFENSTPSYNETPQNSSQKPLLKSIFQSADSHPSTPDNNSPMFAEQLEKGENKFNASPVLLPKASHGISSDTKKNSPSEQFICYACIRQFINEETLLKHQTSSALHKHNLKKIW